jgi:hypothetical protein
MGIPGDGVLLNLTAGTARTLVCQGSSYRAASAATPAACAVFGTHRPTTGGGPTAAASSARPGPITRPRTSPRRGSSAGPSLAAS